MDKEAIKTFWHNMKNDKQRKTFVKHIKDYIEDCIECDSCEHLRTCKLRYLPDHT